MEGGVRRAGPEPPRNGGVGTRTSGTVARTARRNLPADEHELSRGCAGDSARLEPIPGSGCRRNHRRTPDTERGVEEAALAEPNRREAAAADAAEDVPVRRTVALLDE